MVSIHTICMPPYLFIMINISQTNKQININKQIKSSWRVSTEDHFCITTTEKSKTVNQKHKVSQLTSQ